MQQRNQSLPLLPVPSGKILVALSGGADSVALLHALLAQGAKVEALHCNFQLRGEESLRDENFVVQLCDKLNVPLHITHFETRAYAQEKGISIEMAARELRYAWFEEMRQQLQANYIAVAHHEDDQAETLLLNLLRGTGLRGLAGMKEENGHLIRPLLHTSRSKILDYLQQIQQDYVTDSTNLERDALRNRIRLDIMPLLKDINPLAVKHIAEAAHKVAEALPYYERGLASESVLTTNDAEQKVLTVRALESQTLLHECLASCGFTSAQESDIYQHMNEEPGAVYESNTHRLLRNRGELILQRKGQAEHLPEIVCEYLTPTNAVDYLHAHPTTPDVAYLDADTITHPLSVRHPKQGDRFRPLGMKGTRLVSDFLTDLKLSRFEKEQQWLVCSEDKIVWVHNQRIHHDCRITPHTKRILVLHLKEK